MFGPMMMISTGQWFFVIYMNNTQTETTPCFTIFGKAESHKLIVECKFNNLAEQQILQHLNTI